MAVASSDSPEHAAGEDVAAPLDSLLVDAVFSPVRRFIPGMSGLRLGARLLVHPVAVGRRVVSAARELGKVATGFSAVAPNPRDRRSTEPAWSDNLVLKRVLQSYLVAGNAARGLVSAADLAWRDRERMTFVADTSVRSTPGSWWTDFVVWFSERAGAEKAAPKTLGDAGHEILSAAPGRYVFAKRAPMVTTP